MLAVTARWPREVEVVDEVVQRVFLPPRLGQREGRGRCWRCRQALVLNVAVLVVVAVLRRRIEVKIVVHQQVLWIEDGRLELVRWRRRFNLLRQLELPQRFVDFQNEIRLVGERRQLLRQLNRFIVDVHVAQPDFVLDARVEILRLKSHQEWHGRV